MSDSAPIKLGVAGLGGYARNITEVILEHGEQVRPPMQLAASCDPDISTNQTFADELSAKGVRIYDDFKAMVDGSELDAVWLPIPISLHVPFAKYALDRGLAVMIEKPVAGTLQEVDELIEARDAAGRPVLVGFQDIYDEQTLPIKRRLMAGQDGPLRRATLTACWPRTDQYFSRNNWAGRQRSGDTWVLDSPINNALSHPVNLVMFLLGQTEESSAKLVKIEAELYRAAAIENYDTISARVHFEQGPPLLILMTHACTDTDGPWLHLTYDRFEVLRDNSSIRIVDQGEQRDLPTTRGKREQMLQGFANAIRGNEDDSIASATLETSRMHTLLVNAISQATPIVQVPEDSIELVSSDRGKVRCIKGINQVFAQCAADGKMLHESSAYDFTEPARSIDIKQYTQFDGPALLETGSPSV